MKKLYLVIVSALFAGSMMAQSTISTTTQTTSKGSSSSVNHKQESVNPSAKIQIVDLPGFPAYRSTDNKEVDDFNYSVAKQNWINENQEIYNAYQYMLEKGISYELNLPGYPVYTCTGNNESDYAAYKEALLAWSTNNPDLVSNEVRKFYKSTHK